MRKGKIMTKHTNGPWEYSKSDFDDGKFSIYHYGPIAYTGDNGNGPENAEANARLIAAAPDLLACLIDCNDLLCTVVDVLGKNDPLSEEAEARIGEAIRAIAKAEGRKE